LTLNADARCWAQRTVVLFVGITVTVVVQAVTLLKPGRHFTDAEQLAINTREDARFAFAFVFTASLPSTGIVFVDFAVAVVVQSVTDFVYGRDTAKAYDLSGVDIANQVSGTTLADVGSAGRSDWNTFIGNAVTVVVQAVAYLGFRTIAAVALH